MPSSRFAMPIVAFTILPGMAHAHPGHGNGDGTSVLHFMASPLHALPVLGFSLLLAATWLIAFHRRKTTMVAARGARALAIGGASSKLETSKVDTSEA